MVDPTYLNIEVEIVELTFILIKDKKGCGMSMTDAIPVESVVIVIVPSVLNVEVGYA